LEDYEGLNGDVLLRSDEDRTKCPWSGWRMV